MKIKILWAVVAICSVSVQSSFAQSRDIVIVPEPQCVVQEDAWCEFASKLTIAAGNNQIENVVKTFARSKDLFGIQLKFIKDCEKADIVADISETMGDEEYDLSVKNGRISIAGGSESGVMWGLQTLRQIFAQCPCPGLSTSIPSISVLDKPASKVREIQVGTVTPEIARGIVEMASMHKINVVKMNIQGGASVSDYASSLGVRVEPSDAAGDDVSDIAAVEHKLLPEMAGLAEEKWSGFHKDDMKRRVSEAILPLYRMRRYNYNADAYVICDTIPVRGDHYPFRRAFEKITPISHNSIVLFGDSLTERGDWGGFFQDGRMVNRGLGGDRICGFASRVDHIIEAKPAAILFMGGVNDIIFTTITWEKLLSQIEDVLDRIERGTPKTRVYIQSALPVNEPVNPQYLPGINKRIEHYNVLLKELCTRRGLTFIDIWTPMQENGAMPRYRTQDGIHLTADGYEVWVNVLKATVKELKK